MADVRTTLQRRHPNLHKAYMAYAVLTTALGLNFLFLTPTFDPLDIPKVIPGVVFLVVGLVQAMSLRFFYRYKLIQLTMAATISLMFFWCGALTFDFFRLGLTSLQLPLTFLGLGALGMPLLSEPPSNPVAQVGSHGF